MNKGRPFGVSPDQRQQTNRAGIVIPTTQDGPVFIPRTSAEVGSQSSHPSISEAEAQAERAWIAKHRAKEPQDKPDQILLDTFPTRPEMSKPVLFYGKPGQLDDVLTYAEITNTLQGNADDRSQSGLLASLFRGQALHWLTRELQANQFLFRDYTKFKERVKDAFGLSAEAEKARAARRLASISQRGPAQQYAIEFRQIIDALKLDDATAKATFKRGLKLHVREAIVTAGVDGTFEEVVTEAVRIDTELYHARRQAGSRSGQQRQGGKGTLKCHSCGKFGHKARECRSGKQEN